MALSQTERELPTPEFDPSDEELTSRIAWYYYHDGLTQSDIGERLGISRVKVSRLLEKGRKTGLIQVTINSRYKGCFALEVELVKQFGLHEAIVIPELEGADTNDRLGQAASQYLMGHLAQHDLLAIGWGDTVTKTLQRLHYAISGHNVSIVSLTGGVASYVNGTGLLSTSLKDGQGIHLIPAPILASNEVVASTLKDEPQIKSILAMAKTANYALVGIGGISEDATLVTSQYVSGSELLLYKRQGAVGDILGQFYDQDGVLLDIPLHKRIVGYHLADLNHIQCVIGVAGGLRKRDAICGALAGRYLDILITDQPTAEAILRAK